MSIHYGMQIWKRVEIMFYSLKIWMCNDGSWLFAFSYAHDGI